MRYNDRLDGSIWDKVKCTQCGKIYECREEEQEPGFRSKDYEICPYCGNVNDSSMDYEFFTRKFE